MQEKFENIQGLRGIAVLAVLLFHLAGFEKQFFVGTAVLPVLFNLGCSGVDLFFVISGFVMVVMTKNRFGSLSQTGHFIYQRITRIYPMYWIYASILLLAHHFILHEYTNLQSAYIWKSYFLIPQDDNPFLPVAWTLIHEMYFYIVMTLFLLGKQKRFMTWLGVWVSGLIIGNIFFHYKPHFLTASLNLALNPLTFEFIFGCLMGYLITQCKKIQRQYILCILSMFLFLIGSFFCFQYINNSPPGIMSFNWRRMFCFGIPAAIFLYTIVLLEAENKLLPKFLRNIGNYSYSIYLSHLLVLSAMVKIFNKLHNHGVLMHDILLTSGFVVALIVGKYSYEFVEKPILEFMRKGWVFLKQVARISEA